MTSRKRESKAGFVFVRPTHTLTHSNAAATGLALNLSLDTITRSNTLLNTMPFNLTQALALGALLAVPFSATCRPTALGTDIAARADAAGGGWTCADSTHFKQPDGMIRECAPGAMCTTTKFVQWNPCGFIDEDGATPGGKAAEVSKAPELPDCEDEGPAGPEEKGSPTGGESAALPAASQPAAMHSLSLPAGQKGVGTATEGKASLLPLSPTLPQAVDRRGHPRSPPQPQLRKPACLMTRCL